MIGRYKLHEASCKVRCLAKVFHRVEFVLVLQTSLHVIKYHSVSTVTRLINKTLMILERAYLQITTLTQIISPQTFHSDTEDEPRRHNSSRSICSTGIRNTRILVEYFSPPPLPRNPIIRFIVHTQPASIAINRRPGNMRTNGDTEASDGIHIAELARFHRSHLSLVRART